MTQKRFPLNLGDRCRCIRLTHKIVKSGLKQKEFNVRVDGIHFINNWHLQDFFEAFSQYGEIEDIKTQKNFMPGITAYCIEGLIKFKNQEDADLLIKEANDPTKKSQLPWFLQVLRVEHFVKEQDKPQTIEISDFKVETLTFDI